ncbi:protein YLS7-like isoform X2 [Asparagus officinalis]|nr:protein YLS7-like isoform X2 [Asparagus officinalis]
MDGYYDSKETDVLVPSVSVDNSGQNSSRVDGGALSSPPSKGYGKSKSKSKVCDLYTGKWVYDPAGPLYTSHTCPIIVQSQNCQGNGRPDKDYENWRWRPNQCEIPRFDGRKFLELMRGKTLAFVGDSLARNQMDSLLCILWQTEVPINRGNHQMDKWYFQSTSTTIARVWSAWLVHNTPISSSSSSSRAVNVHIDTPDSTITNFLHSFDVLLLSSGHWFSAESSYLLNNTIVGGRFSHANKAKKRKDIIKFYGMTIRTAITTIADFNYTGLTILRSYSPEHYEGGDWDTGGSCKKVNKPARKSVRSGYVNEMYKQQVENFESVVRKVKNGAKLRFMDITDMSGYRNDGHAGIYSGKKARKKKAAEDCVHWCMPGIADSWNEVLFEILKREL